MEFVLIGCTAVLAITITIAVVCCWISTDDESDGVIQYLEAIYGVLGTSQEGVSVMSHLERLTESVRQVTTKADSLITLVTGMAEKIRELSTDPVALNALADELDAQSGELQAAIDANTEQPPQT